MEQTGQAVKSCERFEPGVISQVKVLLAWTGKVHFCTFCEIAFLVQLYIVGGP